MDRGIIVQEGERKVVYDGRTWHQSKTARYFYTHVSIAGKRRHVALHKYVFEKFSGKAVSPGHDVHHKDHNYRNNLFSNLVELTKSDHLSYHGRRTWADDRERMVAATQAGRDAATAWHASEAGRQWHSQHGKTVWQNRESFKV